MSARFLKIAVFYLLLGIGLGIFMAATHQFENRPVHTHINLAGWASLAIMAFAYKVFPALEKSKLATTHFWLHNVGLPVMIIGIFSIFNGQPQIGDAMAGIGSTVVALGMLAFAVNVWRHAA